MDKSAFAFVDVKKLTKMFDECAYLGLTTQEAISEFQVNWTEFQKKKEEVTWSTKQEVLYISQTTKAVCPSLCFLQSLSFEARGLKLCM